MDRARAANRFGRAGYCDACQRSCLTLDQAGSLTEPGIDCYYCGRGQFRHRGLWYMMLCPACLGEHAWCDWCRGFEFLPVPIE